MELPSIVERQRRGQLRRQGNNQNSKMLHLLTNLKRFLDNNYFSLKINFTMVNTASVHTNH